MMKKRTVLIIPAIILCIIISIFFRLFFYHNMVTLGDGYIDSETGLPYLLEMDCYYHLRMTKDIASYGHPGDTLQDGKAWDSISYAPEGRSADLYKPLLAYITIAVKELISVFRPVSLAQTAYWLSAFMSALVVIPVFLLTYEMCGLAGAVTASVLSTLNYGFYSRSLPGFYDTDGVILLFSCFLYYFGIKLIKGWQEKNKRSMILNGAGFVVSLAALYNCWLTYYVFSILFFGALILFILLNRINGSEKKSFFSIPLLLSAFVCIIILILKENLISETLAIFTRIFTKETGVFPNIYSSITELQKLSFFGGQLSDLFEVHVIPDSNINIINSSGGVVLFLFAAVMCVILIVRMVRKDIRPEYILLLFWYALTLWLSLGGFRFILLFSVPAAILAGNLTATIFSVLNKRNILIRYAAKCIIMVSLLLPSFYSAYAYSTEPTFSPYGDIADGLLKIRENTPENTILANWWDLGYFLEEKSGRKTLFDGGSQSDKRAYFVSRALATTDEDLSANIFNMLCGSGDKGIDLCLSTLGETEETVLFTVSLLSGSKAEAGEKLLKKGLSEERVHEITGLLFPENVPPAKFVLTPELPWIYRWFSLIGFGIGEGEDKHKNFKADVILEPLDFSKNSRTAFETEYGYYVIIEKNGDGYYACTSETEEPSGKQPLCIEKLIIVDDNGCEEYVQNNELSAADDPDPEKRAIPWTAVVQYDEQESTLSLISPSLRDSVFGRMLYLNGEGLTRYKAEPEYYNGINGIMVYNIN